MDERKSQQNQLFRQLRWWTDHGMWEKQRNQGCCQSVIPNYWKTDIAYWMNKCVKGANLREKIGSLVLTMLGLTLPLDIQWRCWIGSLLDPLEMRWEGRTGAVSIEMVFNTQDLISPPETQYISRREHLRAESWATPIFGGWDMRKNQHQGWRRSLNQENVGPGSQGKKCFKGGSDQQCQLADRW